MFGITPAVRRPELGRPRLHRKQQFEQITSIDKAAWQAELKLHTELFDKLEYHLPQDLEETKAQLEKRLAA